MSPAPRTSPRATAKAVNASSAAHGPHYEFGGPIGALGALRTFSLAKESPADINFESRNTSLLKFLWLASESHALSTCAGILIGLPAVCYGLVFVCNAEGCLTLSEM